MRQRIRRKMPKLGARCCKSKFAQSFSKWNVYFTRLSPHDIHDSRKAPFVFFSLALCALRSDPAETVEVAKFAALRDEEHDEGAGGDVAEGADDDVRQA